MSGQAKHFYAFGPFRLDSEKRVLVRDGTPVPLAPKVAETLLLLVENAGHLVDKDDLMKRVWPDAFVFVRIGAIRNGDWAATVHRRYSSGTSRRH